MSTTASSLWRWFLAGLAVGVIALALVVLEHDSAVAQPGAALTMRSQSVDIAHFAFHPPTLTIAAGTKVTFVNSSRIAHTATRAGSFDTGHIQPGSSISVRFKHAGTFSYHCSIHPFMHGKIVVR